MIFWQAFLDALRRFLTKGGTVRASHVALSMMLAIFPFCMLALSVAALVSMTGLTSSQADLGEVLTAVFGAWPDAIAGPIESEVRAVLESSGGSTITVGAVLTIFFASNGFDAMRIAVSEAYHDSDPRPVWKQRLIAVSFAIGGALAVALTGVFGVLIPVYLRYAAEVLPDLPFTFDSHRTVGVLVTTFVPLFGLVACHKWLSGVARPVRALLPGILLTLALWIAIARGFEFYVRNFPTYSVTYAGLAGVIAALVFMYLMAAVFVLGAEYNARLGEIAQQTRRHKDGQ